jgi:signal peptidase II
MKLGMRLVRKTAIIMLIVLCCFGCDQATKRIARRNLPESESISLLCDSIRLQLIENSGGFLSLGDGLAAHVRFWVFIPLVALFLGGMLLYLFVQKHLALNQVMALALISGGGIGNLTDRIFNHCRVVDFMNVGIGSLRTGVFNVADIAILWGAAWFLLICVHSAAKATDAR